MSIPPQILAVAAGVLVGVKIVMLLKFILRGRKGGLGKGGGA